MKNLEVEIFVTSEKRRTLLWDYLSYNTGKKAEDQRRVHYYCVFHPLNDGGVSLAVFFWTLLFLKSRVLLP